MIKLDHPCRDTCSGWKQGFERGRAEERELNAQVAEGIAGRPDCVAKSVALWVAEAIRSSGTVCTHEGVGRRAIVTSYPPDKPDQVVKERDFACQQWRDWNAEADALAEKLEAHDASASREIDRLQGNWEAAEKEVAQLKLALEIAKELRIYCLGTDASTESMIQRFDAAIRALSEKERTE